MIPVVTWAAIKIGIVVWIGLATYVRFTAIPGWIVYCKHKIECPDVQGSEPGSRNRVIVVALGMAGAIMLTLVLGPFMLVTRFVFRKGKPR